MTLRGWSRDELLLAFNLYCKTPFGRLHRNNLDIIALADHLGRTPSAVAMKLVNFASLDPTHQQRNVSGLRNASQSDQAIFEEFSSDWERLAFESEMASERIGVSGTGPPVGHNLSPSVAVPRQPGSLHDRAFDRGFLAVDADLRIAVSPRLLTESPSEVHEVALIQIAGKPLALPNRFGPDRAALAHIGRICFLKARLSRVLRHVTRSTRSHFGVPQPAPPPRLVTRRHEPPE
jgi:hypothetical protein